MLKKEIKYENLDGVEEVDSFYFNLNKAELYELFVDERNGESLMDYFQKIVNTQNKKELIAEFKKLIMLSYGVRDGSIFRKSEQISLEFTQHPAYDVLFWELTTDDKASAEFINGIMPKNFQADIDAITKNGVTPDDIREMVAKAQETAPDTPAAPTPPPGFQLPPPAPSS